MVRHTAAENAEYWRDQIDGWIADNVHGKSTPEVVAIAGDAIADFGDGWGETDVETVRDEFRDSGFPNTRIQDTRNGTLRLRVDANDDRLPVAYK